MAGDATADGLDPAVTTLVAAEAAKTAAVGAAPDAVAKAAEAAALVVFGTVLWLAAAIADAGS